MTLTLSIIAACYNEEENLEALYNSLDSLLSTLPKNTLPSGYEIILVDDGSNDHTWDILSRLSKLNSNVRALRFSRNFGQQAAFCAGLAAARGKAVITMDADLQDPPSLIPELLSKWQSGLDIVYTARRSRTHDNFSKRLFAKCFYTFINKVTGLHIPAQGGEFRLLDRKVVDVLCKMQDRQPFLRGMVAWCGFKSEVVLYDRPARHAGTAKFSFRKSLELAIDAIVSFSKTPLRLALPVGATLFFLGLLSLCINLFQIASTGNFDQLALVVPVLLLATGFQLVFLGIIGEYLARNLEHATGRPLYVIAEVTPLKDMQNGTIQYSQVA